MLRILFILLAIGSLTRLDSKENPLSINAQIIDASYLVNLSEIKLRLEHAVSPEQLSWGLMQRRSMPDNQGMTFNFPNAMRRSFWMFNCFIDLSVAYLDANKIIREIHELKAYPHWMDPNRPVHNVNDFNLYSFSDPTIQFFEKKSVPSKIDVAFALEFGAGWFRKNNIKAGDRAVWNIDSQEGKIIKTLDIGSYEPSENLPIVLDFQSEKELSVWSPTQLADRDIAFVGKSNKIMQISKLPGGRAFKTENRPVVYANEPARKIIIAPPGWFARRGIKEGEIIWLIQY